MQFANNESHLYIDGGCLQRILQTAGDRYFGGALPEIDWSRLRGSHAKAFFYDAVPARNHNEDGNAYDARVAEKRAYLQGISRQPFYHVRTGEAKKRHRVGMEQKRVDVQLTVDALLAAARAGLPKITLITGDLDFAPLIDALVDLGVAVTLLYPINETSIDLIETADVAQPVHIAMLEGWMTSAFKIGRKLPSAGLEPPAVLLGIDMIHDWASPDDGTMNRLYQDATTSILTFGKQTDDGLRLVVRASNNAHVRPYLKDVFEIELPDEVPI